MEQTFGIISEGVTDQITLEKILFGYFSNKDLPVIKLQPKENEPGNWDKVFKYCESTDFKGAFAYQIRFQERKISSFHPSISRNSIIN